MEPLLEQKPFLLHSTKIILKDSHNIVVEEKRGFSTTRQTFTLDRINPEPAKVQAIRFQWAIVSVLMTMLTLFVFIQSFQKEGFNPVVFTTSLILAIVTYATITKAVADYRNHFVFTEPQTNRYLFAIRTNNPSKLAVEAFIETLGRHIRSIRYPEGLSQQQRNEQHKKHVQFLFEEGVLTANEHATIMARLEKKLKSAGVVKLVSDDI